MSKQLLVTGYKNFELGIFKDKDDRVTWIKKAIRNDFIRYIEEDFNWFIFTGQLGFEYWALEVAKELKEEYAINIATIFLFENHGENWNETNQEKLTQFKSVDFTKYLFDSYQNPQQFRIYNQFLIDHTNEAYIFYDPDNETNLKYLLHFIKEQPKYSYHLLTFERLNELIADE